MAEQLEKETTNIDAELLMSSLKDDKIDQFRNEFMDLHPYDQAQFFSKLDKEYRKRIYHYLSPEDMAELFENLELEEDEYEQLLSEMDPSYVATMLGHMYADDAVDVLNELDKEQTI